MLHSDHLLLFINLFFLVKGNFIKKLIVVIVVIGVLHNMKLSDLLRKKLFFFMQEVTLYFLFDTSH